MGLLDEAIRDHLDLKRRRGADPADIERAEREALGPVRRDPFEHGPDDFESASMPEERPRAYDHEEELYDDEGYEEYGPDEEWEEDFEEEPHDEGAAPPSYTAEAGAGDETMQYDVEEALASDNSQAKPAPEWAEQSDEWVEQSEEWVEPSRGPAEPEHEDGHGLEPEEPAQDDHPGAPPPSLHDPAAEHGARSEEDVLEETPEFLQDAPDHDRLWFEQRPPRDFDFDG
jgi:hypothetical protein